MPQARHAPALRAVGLVKAAATAPIALRAAALAVSARRHPQPSHPETSLTATTQAGFLGGCGWAAQSPPYGASPIWQIGGRARAKSRYLPVPLPGRGICSRTVVFGFFFAVPALTNSPVTALRSPILLFGFLLIAAQTTLTLFAFQVLVSLFLRDAARMCHLGTGQPIISTGRAIIVTPQRIILGGWLAQVAGHWAVSGPWLARVDVGWP